MGASVEENRGFDDIAADWSTGRDAFEKDPSDEASMANAPPTSFDEALEGSRGRSGADVIEPKTPCPATVSALCNEGTEANAGVADAGKAASFFAVLTSMNLTSLGSSAGAGGGAAGNSTLVRCASRLRKSLRKISTRSSLGSEAGV